MRLSLAAAVLWTIALCPLARAQSLDHTQFPARGAQQAILTISSFGRYSITVSSAQGVALQLVDRMAGPGDIQGVPGASDGRIDAFLERGDYKIRLIADARGTGTATLAVHPFTELQPDPVQLVENKPVIATLADDQQRSWWLLVPSRGTYNFEAGGRYLNELRLWKDGSWVIAASPITALSNANPSQPMALRQLSAQLEPGLYRLTAYGGPSQPWASGSKDAPFLLRWGVPALSDAGTTTHTESRLGIDRFLVPGDVTGVNLVLDHAETAQISAQAYGNNVSDFDQSQASTASMDKTFRDPVAVLALQGGAPSPPYLVTVDVRPGETYRLEAVNAAGNSRITPLPGTGANTLLAVTLPGHPDDEIDPGFILVDNDLNQDVVAAAGIDLDTALPWRRRFNLLNPVSTFLHTSKPIDLRVDGAGVNAQFIVQRFLTNPPPDLVVPLPQPSGGIWPLTPGYYVLTAEPLANGRGILTMSLYPQGSPAPKADSPRIPAAIFPDVSIDPFNGDRLYTSLDGGVGYGLRQAPLPAALDQPISFELGAGQTAGFPISVPADGALQAEDDTGAPLGFSLDGSPVTGRILLHPGQYQFSITGPGPANREVTVTQTPFAQLASTPLPAIPADQTAPPVLPALPPGQPYFTDLAQGQSITFAVPVGQDSLYRFETTGLLETGGAIRTRTNPSLRSVEGNGIGRNFLLQPFLREGDYQLTVTAQGQTAGHAGIAVTPTPLLDEGVLAPNLPARMTLAPGQAAIYHFHIAAEGTYHIFTLGLGHDFAMRLEDADGWPLITPGGTADATLDFVPGDYRMILLPGPVENRAVTMLQPVLPPITYSGHGPLQLPFGQSVTNRWMEPAPGAARHPDVWNFTLPAAANISMTIDHGMAATITPSGAATPVAGPAASFAGKLPAGDYVLTAQAAVPNNRVDYNLELDTAELLPGQSRSINAPGSLPVSLGGGQVEISSFGNQDVKAELYDANFRLVAANDDRDNDWNFLIIGSFPAGEYTLQVDPVGSDSAQTTVSVTAPAVVNDKPLKLGETVSTSDGLVHVLSIPALPKDSLLLAGATAAVPVGLILEAQQGGAWQDIASTSGINPYLAMPAGVPGSAYRLRAWAEDHGATPVAITAQSVTAPAIPGYAVGLYLQSAALGRQQITFRRLAIPHPEILQRTGISDTLLWSGTPGTPAAQDPSGNIVASSPTLWLVDKTQEAFGVNSADLTTGPVRLTLRAGERLALPVPPSGAFVLWSAQAQGTQPGLQVGNGGVMAPAPNLGLFKTTMAFQSPDDAAPVLQLFQAGPPQAALPVTVQRTVFTAPAALPVQTGDNDATLAPNTALKAALGKGWKRLTLNLPAGIAAVLVNGNTAQSLVLGNGTAPDVLDTQADTLILLNPAADPAPFNIAVQPESGPALALAPGGLLTPYSTTPAVLHIALQGPEARLRIAGAATGITVADADGALTTGDAAQGGAGGTALVSVQPGLAVISQDGNGATNQVARNVTVPGSIPLSGASAFLYLPAAGARLVHFETDTPIVLRNGNAIQLFPQGASLNLFQARNSPLDLEILPVSGALSGSARFDAEPAIPITDGLGPKFLAGPGQSRLFSFSLNTPRGIGVGVRGSVDDARVRLLASDGTELGTGVIHMQRLPAGTYYLAVDVPSDDAASIIQPALVGLTPPDDGPPPDVAEGYREMGDQ